MPKGWRLNPVWVMYRAQVDSQRAYHRMVSFQIEQQAIAMANERSVLERVADYNNGLTDVNPFRLN